MKGSGIDLVEIQRIGETYQRRGSKFLERLFTAEERAQGSFHRGRRQLEFWAGRFAAKEAVAKALGVGFGKSLSWQEIEILADSRGAPYVLLSGSAAALAREASIGKVLVSITHSKEYAMALAVAVGEEGES